MKLINIFVYISLILSLSLSHIHTNFIILMIRYACTIHFLTSRVLYEQNIPYLGVDNTNHNV